MKPGNTLMRCFRISPITSHSRIALRYSTSDSASANRTKGSKITTHVGTGTGIGDTANHHHAPITSSQTIANAPPPPAVRAEDASMDNSDIPSRTNLKIQDLQFDNFDEASTSSARYDHDDTDFDDRGGKISRSRTRSPMPAFPALWLAGQGLRYKTAKKGVRNWLGATPFPDNPTFNPPAPTASATQDEIYNLFKSDPQIHSVERLAKEYRMEKERIEAIVRLGRVRDQWKEKGNDLQEVLNDNLQGYLCAKASHRIDRIPSEAYREVAFERMGQGVPLMPIWTILRTEAEAVQRLKSLSEKEHKVELARRRMSPQEAQTPWTAKQARTVGNPKYQPPSELVQDADEVVYTEDGKAETVPGTQWQFVDTSLVNTQWWHSQDKTQEFAQERWAAKVGRPIKHDMPRFRYR